MKFSILGRKNRVNTDDFGALEAKTHNICSVFLASGSKRHGIYSVFPLGSSKNTGVDAVFTMLQDVVPICGKRENIVCYDVFASGAQKMALCWPIFWLLAHLGAMLAHFGADIGPSWSYFGPILGL